MKITPQDLKDIEQAVKTLKEKFKQYDDVVVKLGKLVNTNHFELIISYRENGELITCLYFLKKGSSIPKRILS